jgi:hypothetical protein
MHEVFHIPTTSGRKAPSLVGKGNNQSHDSSREGGNERACRKKNFRGKGLGTIMVKDLIFTVSIVVRMNMKQRLV